MDRGFARRQFLGRLGGTLALGAAAPQLLLRSAAGAREAAAEESHSTGGDPVPGTVARDLPAWMQTARVPGVAIASLRGGRLAGVRGFGVRDVDSKDPVTADTVFEAASLSKVVTAYTALRLVQRGKLALDTPLVTYAPSPCEPDQASLAGRITLRHALTHSTGFRNWRFRKEDKLTVDFPPGSKYSYSGEGIMWVERAIEAVTGQPFARHVQEAVLLPLGMRVSSFVWRPEFDRLASRGHDGDGAVSESWVMKLARKADEVGHKGAKQPLDWTYNDAEQGLVAAGYPTLPTMVTPNAAGSLFTTAGEYAVFLSRLLESKPRDAASLSDELRAAMRTPQIQVAGLISWGLGVGLETDRTPPPVWHWGDSGPAKTFALGDPATGDGIVVFTNASRGLHICERVARALTNRDHAAFLFI